MPPAKSFGITNVQLSCNDTSSLGTLIFGGYGQVYTTFDKDDPEKYQLKQSCILTLSDKDGNTKDIVIEPNGYIH
jgi:hypothetical protein